MLGLASFQDVAGSRLKAARFPRRAILRHWPAAPELPVGAPGSHSELAPQVHGAGQNSRPVPTADAPASILAWTTVSSQDHPIITTQ